MQPSGSFEETLKEISRFFQGRDEVHQSLQRVARRLDRAGIPYALIGGMAVHLHGHHQTTADVDLLLTTEGLAEFRKRFVPKYYEQVPQHPRRFVDRVNQIGIDVRETFKYPGNGKPKPVAFPDPCDVSQTIQKIRVVNLTTLIQLKLAAHRFQDLADVVSLIRVKNLDESFQEKLDPSVRQDYLKCQEAKRREDECEKSLDQAFVTNQ